MKWEEFLARIIPYAGCALLLGVGAWYLHDRAAAWLWLLLVVFGYGAYRYSVYERMRVVFAGICLIICIIIGYWYTDSYETHNTFVDIPYGTEIDMSGIITGVPDVRYEHQYLEVQPLGERYRIRVRTEKSQWYISGDHVRVSGRLEQPEAFTTDTGKTFDYPRYLAVSGVFAELRSAQVRRESRSTSFIARSVAQVRESLEDSVQKFIPQSAQGLSLGVVLGSKSELSDSDNELYRRAGISHIIVLSGFNITILAVVLTVLLSRVRLSPALILVAQLSIIWMFIAMVGASASVVRAGSMVTIVLLVGWLDRDSAPMRSLLYAVVVMVVLNPRIIPDDIGFQLSVLATTGLIVGGKYFGSMLGSSTESGNGTMSALREIISSTTSATVATLPLVIARIGSIAALGVITNVLVVWVVPLLMLVVTLVWVAAAVVPILASLLGQVAGAMVWYIHTVSENTIRYAPYGVWESLIIMGISVWMLLLVLKLVGQKQEV